MNIMMSYFKELIRYVLICWILGYLLIIYHDTLYHSVIQGFFRLTYESKRLDITMKFLWLIKIIKYSCLLWRKLICDHRDHCVNEVYTSVNTIRNICSCDKIGDTKCSQLQLIESYSQCVLHSLSLSLTPCTQLSALYVTRNIWEKFSVAFSWNNSFGLVDGSARTYTYIHST